jgi:hypothetical protein
MGQSNDAILVYGFDLGEEEGRDHERITTLLEGDEEAAEKLFEEISDKHGVELVRHGSDECELYVLGFAGTQFIARRGYPIEVFPHDLGAKDTWKMDKKLALAAAVLGVKPRPGKWLLCSYCC